MIFISRYKNTLLTMHKYVTQVFECRNICQITYSMSYPMKYHVDMDTTWQKEELEYKRAENKNVAADVIPTMTKIILYKLNCSDYLVESR